MTDDFLDSYAPIDSEVVTDAPWPTPEPFDWEEAVGPTPLERLLAWLTGEESV